LDEPSDVVTMEDITRLVKIIWCRTNAGNALSDQRKIRVDSCFPSSCRL